MKPSQTSSFSQMTIERKLTIAFTIPLTLVLMVGLAAYSGIHRIQEDYRQIHKIVIESKEMPQKTALAPMLGQAEKRIKTVQSMIVLEAIISIILMALIGFVTVRSISRELNSRQNNPEEKSL